MLSQGDWEFKASLVRAEGGRNGAVMASFVHPRFKDKLLFHSTGHRFAGQQVETAGGKAAVLDSSH